MLETGADLVTPQLSVTGRVTVTTKSVVFTPGTVMGGGARMSLSTARSSSLGHSQLVDTAQTSDAGAGTRTWPLAALQQIHSRRYRLRKCALELFFVDRSNSFFSFADKTERKRVYQALIAARPPNLSEMYGRSLQPDTLFKRSGLTERWVRREVSNFDYLMHLNTLAGRSFNDITQYPVFPWVLTDYTSDTIDLEDPSVYRDLSKPVGALEPKRLEKFKERYREFDDPVVPKFHYGSHYSSSGIVLYYLVRLEPFTSLAIDLQGGHFDHADRMFGDIAGTWSGCLEDMADVKELVPEFYHCPEAFMNKNNIDFGCTQTGERLSEVKLPPWADGPHDFVTKMRAALESEHVSAKLHEWIDLVFGFRQRGAPAVEANNVFFYMTYEGLVDIDSITDPVQLKSTQDQIEFFGQTPSQLLTAPHPRRGPREDAIVPLHHSPSTAQVYPLPVSVTGTVATSSLAVAPPDCLVVVGQALEYATHKLHPNKPDGKGRPFVFQPSRSASSTASALFGSGSSMLRRTFGMGDVKHGAALPTMRATLDPNVDVARCCVVTPDGAYAIVGGHADSSFKLYAVKEGQSSGGERCVRSVVAHTSPITALGLSVDGRILVAASRDTTLTVWVLPKVGVPSSQSSAGTSLGDAARKGSSAAAEAAGGAAGAAGAAVALSAAGSIKPESLADAITLGAGELEGDALLRGPVHTLRGNTHAVEDVAVSADLDLVASVTRAGGVVLHSLLTGRVHRRVPELRGTLCALTSTARIVVWDPDARVLRSASVNGDVLAVATLPPGEGDPTALIAAADGHALYVALAGEGVECGVVLRAVPRVGEVLHRFNTPPATALALTTDNTNLVVATEKGELLALTDPAVALRLVSNLLRVGWGDIL